jgi:hypothetical protein
LFAVALLTIRHEFFQFAAESRPYMLWVFLFTASLMVVSSLAYRRWETVKAGTKAVLALLLLGLTLVSSAGVFQALSFMALLSVWHHKSEGWRAWRDQRAIRFQLPLAMLCGGIGLYYCLMGGCLTNYDGDKWDLLRTRSLALVTDVLRLIFPLSLAPCRDRTDPCGVVSVGLNVLVVVAVATLWLWWRKRATLPESKQFALSVILVSVGQIPCAVFVAILVVMTHYFFVPRVFLYLISLRAFLAAAGAYVCVRMILERSGGRFRILEGRALQRLLVAGALAFGVLSHPGHWRIPLVVKNLTDGVKFDVTTCPPPRSMIALVDTEAPQFVAPDGTYEYENYKLNFVLGFDEQLKACGWRAAAAPLIYVVPDYAKADRGIYGYEIRNANETGSPILGFLHQPVLPRAR